MFTADPLIRQIGETEHGAARLAAITEAIREADNASAHYWRFYFRFEAIKESIFHDDAFKAILSFPELLQIFDTHPELEDDFSDDMLCAFKWILENSTHFYQVSRDQIDRNYEEYKRRCERYGVSLRVYHMKRCSYLLKVDKEAARAEYEAFHHCKRDGYSDCLACETHFDMKVALELGDEEEALRIAKPILDGDQSCAEIPHCTYARLTDHYLYAGDLDEAAYYGELCDRYTRGDAEFLDATGILLALYSAVDPARGWNLFKQCLPTYMNSMNPTQRLQFADGAFRLMQTLVGINQEQGDSTFSKAPVLAALPLEKTAEGIDLVQVRDYFYREAREAGERLDKRNGSDYYAQQLSRTIVPVVHEAQALDAAPKRPLHGLTSRVPCVLLASLPEDVSVSYEQMQERVKAGVPEDAELVNCTTDEKGLFVSYRRDGRVYDYALTVIQTEDEVNANAVEDLTEETFARMLANPTRYFLHCQIGDKAQLDYHFAMELLCTVLPELIGVIDAINQHAYSADWVRFKGKFDASVSPNDLFGLHLIGDQEKDEVWITTLGLNVLGIRELEVHFADTNNYSMMADILDHAAAQIVGQGMLPDENTDFGIIYIDDEPHHFRWERKPDDLPPDSIAAQVPSDASSGVLMLETDEGTELVAKSQLLANAESLDYGNTNREFHRRIALAKQTAPILLEALQSIPYERAGVRLELRLSEEQRKKFDYGIELLWAEVTEVRDGVIYAALKETSEALPELHEEELLTVDPEQIAAWFFHPQGAEQPIGAQDAYYLLKEGQA
ncbi:MAG: DUF4026 domain-containing protein [Oscillospiraceae bacterium]|nr:DUF4026 domain-containing protein [Oscillospiraceae bacterium]